MYTKLFFSFILVFFINFLYNKYFIIYEFDNKPININNINIKTINSIEIKKYINIYTYFNTELNYTKTNGKIYILKFKYYNFNDALKKKKENLSLGIPIV